MGYTHYWRPQRKFTTDEWTTLLPPVLAAVSIFERDYLLEDKQIDQTRIRFNGVDDDGHETFLIYREKISDFEFCKTAGKPYDRLAVAVLALIETFTPGVLEISSDGDVPDWAAGLQLALEATNFGIIEIPEAVREK